MILIESNTDMRNSCIGPYEAIVVVKENKREDQETTEGILQGLNHKSIPHNPFKSGRMGWWAINTLCICLLPKARTRKSFNDHGVHNKLTQKSLLHRVEQFSLLYPSDPTGSGTAIKL